MASEEGRNQYNTQKKFSKYNKQTVDNLRNEIRTEFKHRIQLQREKQKDLQRNISKEMLRTLVEQSGEDIKNMVISDGTEDLNSMLTLVAEVEQEILLDEQQILGSIYEKELELEVNSLLPRCISCEKMIEIEHFSYKTLICMECSTDFINS